MRAEASVEGDVAPSRSGGWEAARQAGTALRKAGLLQRTEVYPCRVASETPG